MKGRDEGGGPGWSYDSWEPHNQKVEVKAGLVRSTPVTRVSTKRRPLLKPSCPIAIVLQGERCRPVTEMRSVVVGEDGRCGGGATSSGVGGALVALLVSVDAVAAVECRPEIRREASTVSAQKKVPKQVRPVGSDFQA